ncbi:hypothetical protein [Pseudaminobacter sp. NGMCC 1.201702]|uniref:hypothetical protein n=1 Tax=Pseudaminobacter sp. NGMCC 1.201702 TaxID=3391825 RepID=UPI0039EECCC9
MTTLEEFLRARYASLQRQRAELHTQLKVIQKEIDEIEKASRASGLPVVEENPPISVGQLKDNRKKSFTMKEAAVEILQKYPDGLLATEILSRMNELLGTNYPRSSLSPQLSRLKHEGIVYDAKGRWILVPEISAHD